MVQTKKRKTIDILNEIIDYLRLNQASVNEIAGKIGSNWDTVSKYLNFLEGLGVVKKQNNNYIINDEKSINLDDDTIANIPLPQEKKNLIKYIGKKISDEWLRVRGQKPPVTWIHKAAVEVSKKLPSLKIPTGWYYFGQVVLYKFKPEDTEIQGIEEPQEIKNISNFNEVIHLVVQELYTKKYFDLLTYQYSKYQKGEYITKIDLQKKFEETDLFESKSEICSLYYKLAYNFDLNIDDPISKEILDYLKEIISISVSLINKNQVKNNNLLKTQLWEIFCCYWELYCTYNLYQTIDGEIGYPKAVLRPLFKEKVDLHLDLCDQKMELAKAYLDFQNTSSEA